MSEAGDAKYWVKIWKMTAEGASGNILYDRTEGFLSEDGGGSEIQIQMVLR